MLNAFRHQRFDTLVRDRFHIVTDSAQRLSASEIRHGQPTNDIVPNASVLNAFRHQRFDTIAVPNTKPCFLRAQRLSASEIRHYTATGSIALDANVLNAFRHQRFDTGWTSVLSLSHGLCSTPFGIRDSTLELARYITHGVIVLNAFRHQRFDTHKLSTSFSYQCVLNAFRHQRFDTRKVTRWKLNHLKCSTPFGIRDSTPPSAVSNQNCIEVLNAFRHQRFDTIGILNHSYVFTSCSTPFGIRDSTLTRFKNCKKRLKSAQRLSASEIRHDSSSPVSSFPFRAQRLSASEIRHHKA